MPDGPRRAVVLVSGGLDSATALAVARRDGFETFALSFDYGQRHSYELEAARESPGPPTCDVIFFSSSTCVRSAVRR